MIDQQLACLFLEKKFSEYKMEKQVFPSGNIMLDVYLNEKEMFCFQIGSTLGVSLVTDLHAGDLSTVPDMIFNTNSAFECYVGMLMKERI